MADGLGPAACADALSNLLLAEGGGAVALRQAQPGLLLGLRGDVARVALQRAVVGRPRLPVLVPGRAVPVALSSLRCPRRLSSPRCARRSDPAVVLVALSSSLRSFRAGPRRTLLSAVLAFRRRQCRRGRHGRFRVAVRAARARWLAARRAVRWAPQGRLSSLFARRGPGGVHFFCGDWGVRRRRRRRRRFYFLDTRTATVFFTNNLLLLTRFSKGYGVRARPCRARRQRRHPPPTSGAAAGSQLPARPLARARRGARGRRCCGARAGGGGEGRWRRTRGALEMRNSKLEKL